MTSLKSLPQLVRVRRRDLIPDASNNAVPDERGDYTIEGLPRFVKTTLYAEGQDWKLTEVYLELDEQRPVTITRLQRRNSAGIPFHAIFASDGTEIIDSQGPIGNIGAPSGFEGKRHLRQMLEAGSQHLTAKQIEELAASVHD